MLCGSAPRAIWTAYRVERCGPEPSAMQTGPRLRPGHPNDGKRRNSHTIRERMPAKSGSLCQAQGETMRGYVRWIVGVSLLTGFGAQTLSLAATAGPVLF